MSELQIELVMPEQDKILDVKHTLMQPGLRASAWLMLGYTIGLGSCVVVGLDGRSFSLTLPSCYRLSSYHALPPRT